MLPPASVLTSNVWIRVFGSALVYVLIPSVNEKPGTLAWMSNEGWNAGTGEAVMNQPRSIEPAGKFAHGPAAQGKEKFSICVNGDPVYVYVAARMPEEKPAAATKSSIRLILPPSVSCRFGMVGRRAVSFTNAAIPLNPGVLMNSSRHDTLLASVLDAIGNTPLIELSRVARGLHGRIVASWNISTRTLKEGSHCFRAILNLEGGVRYGRCPPLTCARRMATPRLIRS